MSRTQPLHFKGAHFDFDISKDPIIYSILNLTPDSFYDGGVNTGIDQVLHRIETELTYGAKILNLAVNHPSHTSMIFLPMRNGIGWRHILKQSRSASPKRF